MKKLWIGLLAAGSVFAIDEYKSIDKGAIELDFGAGYQAITKGWDADGKSQDNPWDMSVTVVGFQGKYGIADGLDAEVVLNYLMPKVEDESESGLGQPELGFKYTMPTNIGFYLNATLPFGSEDIVGESPVMSFDVGGLHWLESGQFVMASMLGLTYTLEDDDKYQEGMNIDLLLKPGYLANEQTEINLGVAFNYAMEGKWDGEGLDNAGHLLSLRPGVQYSIDDKMAVEAVGNIDVIGKNAAGGWGLMAFFYYSI